MDILERNRVLNELQQQLASGEITIGAAVRRLRKEVTGLQQARFAQMCKLSLRALRQLVRIPRPSGHPFHEHLATDSTVIRPPVPRASGH